MSEQDLLSLLGECQEYVPVGTDLWDRIQAALSGKDEFESDYYEDLGDE